MAVVLYDQSGQGGMSTQTEPVSSSSDTKKIRTKLQDLMCDDRKKKYLGL